MAKLDKRVAELFLNRHHQHKNTGQTSVSELSNTILNITNRIACHESKFLKNTPVTSTPVHVITQK